MGVKAWGRAAIVLATIVISAFSWTAQARAQTLPGPKTVAVTDLGNGGNVELHKGDTLKLRLKATPSTGYTWQIAELNISILALSSGPTYIPPPNVVPGAEGHQKFLFSAVASGRTQLQLSYVRPWEKKNAKPARTFTLNVTVD
jgi:inhibitor of cysteine peptidase